MDYRRDASQRIEQDYQAQERFVGIWNQSEAEKKALKAEVNVLKRKVERLEESLKNENSTASRFPSLEKELQEAKSREQGLKSQVGKLSKPCTNCAQQELRANIAERQLRWSRTQQANEAKSVEAQLQSARTAKEVAEQRTRELEAEKAQLEIQSDSFEKQAAGLLQEKCRLEEQLNAVREALR